MSWRCETALGVLLASCQPGNPADTDATAETGVDPTAASAVPTSTASEEAPRLDVGVLDVGDPGCGLDNGDLGLSYIWIANSTQGTVSKIDSLIAANSGAYARIQRVG